VLTAGKRVQTAIGGWLRIILRDQADGSVTRPDGRLAVTFASIARHLDPENSHTSR
jgi:hypothetical protein